MVIKKSIANGRIVLLRDNKIAPQAIDVNLFLVDKHIPASARNRKGISVPYIRIPRKFEYNKQLIITEIYATF